MVSVSPMTAIAAYKSAAKSMYSEQGIMNNQQAQMRVPPMMEQLGGATPTPSDFGSRMGAIGPQNLFSSGEPPKLSFSSLIESGIQNTISANRNAEYMSMEGIAGRADVTEVVAAISNAEASLNTLVTVRDRVISAYQEILRMPI